MLSTCEIGDEASGFIKYGGFLGYLKNGQLSRTTLFHGVSE
jgi:hypothetical protein